jgi:Icc-related predicted phosphoesterase
MKVLALSDLHDEEVALERIRNDYRHMKLDAVFILGDTTNVSYSFLEETVNSFKNCFFIPGNNEPETVIERARSLPGFVHNKRIELGSYNLVGFGFSPPTPFDTVGELPEERIYEQMKKLQIDRKTILLTHSPPMGILDWTKKGPAGSAAILKIIEEKKPLVNFCGHIHEQCGWKKAFETQVVKVPAAKDYQFCIAEISDKNITADFITCGH